MGRPWRRSRPVASRVSEVAKLDLVAPSSIAVYSPGAGTVFAVIPLRMQLREGGERRFGMHPAFPWHAASFESLVPSLSSWGAARHFFMTTARSLVWWKRWGFPDRPA